LAIQQRHQRKASQNGGSVSTTLFVPEDGATSPFADVSLQKFKTQK